MKETTLGRPLGQKAGEKRLSGRGREKESEKDVFATNAAGILLFINKSSQQLICKIQNPSEVKAK